MKAFFIDDIGYQVKEVQVADDFNFDGRYSYWETIEDAKEELAKIIKADINNLLDCLEELVKS